MRETKAFDSGLDVRLRSGELAFDYGENIFGPQVELRRLNDIRPSLLDPACSGPDPVYGIAMDVGKIAHASELRRRNLLFGIVAYASGTLGEEPVRSQGHVHAAAPLSGWSTPELYEIWSGRAIVYAQERAEDDPGRCIAVKAGPGDKVVVPPNWAHCAINADAATRMVFGAWCSRQYKFDYSGVRARGGMAWFPLLRDGKIEWQANPRYRPSSLEVRKARAYPELALDPPTPIYRQFENDPGSMQWISEPERLARLWETFEP